MSMEKPHHWLWKPQSNQRASSGNRIQDEGWWQCCWCPGQDDLQSPPQQIIFRAWRCFCALLWPRAQEGWPGFANHCWRPCKCGLLTAGLMMKYPIINVTKLSFDHLWQLITAPCMFSWETKKYDFRISTLFDIRMKICTKRMRGNILQVMKFWSAKPKSQRALKGTNTDPSYTHTWAAVWCKCWVSQSSVSCRWSMRQN